MANNFARKANGYGTYEQAVDCLHSKHSRGLGGDNNWNMYQEKGTLRMEGAMSVSFESTLAGATAH